MDEGLRIALDAGDVEDACRAYVNIVWELLGRYRLDGAERYLAAAVRLAEDAEFLAFLSYMHVERAMLEFSRGWWDAAVRSAELSADTSLPVRCPAVTVIGRVAARRGQPEAASLLWTAWDLAVKSGELQRTVVGAGQAGLAVSRCLAERGADHVVLERGRVAERWRTARWDSLRLITPNWMSRLPGWSYPGPDPGGYMSAPELVSYLQSYADSGVAPVRESTTVELVQTCATGLRVVTDQRTWLARNVVTASRCRSPRHVPDGGVLVVGASASGVQIADELRRAGRTVVISVGRHSRLPRRYRGHDIQWWLHRTGILDQTIDQLRDARSARRAPSLQLSGRRHRVDLEALAARGVILAGRLAAADGWSVAFADDLAVTTGAAQARMERLLRSIEALIAPGVDDQAHPLPGVDDQADPLPAFTAPAGPAHLDLRRAGSRP
jgi:putative flavoprotein involved in K+ transport